MLPLQFSSAIIDKGEHGDIIESKYIQPQKDREQPPRPRPYAPNMDIIHKFNNFTATFCSYMINPGKFMRFRLQYGEKVRTGEIVFFSIFIFIS